MKFLRYAFGVRPSWRAFSSVIIKAADAPSDKKEAFAAVTVPYGLTNAGFSFPNCSNVETRIPLSLSTTSLTFGTRIGT